MINLKIGDGKTHRWWPCWLCWRRYLKKFDTFCSKIDWTDWSTPYPCDILIDRAEVKRIRLVSAIRGDGLWCKYCDDGFYGSWIELDRKKMCLECFDLYCPGCDLEDLEDGDDDGNTDEEM